VSEPDEKGRSRIEFGAEVVAEGRLPLAGSHNRLNALAAIAAARHAGVSPADAIAALELFQGVRRRLERRGVANGVAVYDDFAHHPTAIALTIQALRQSQSSGRIIAVLEPRSNTMKLGVMKDRLASSLAEADAAICYSSGLGWDPRQALLPLGDRAKVRAGLEEIVSDVKALARPGDHVLVMSNGAFGGIHDKLLAALAA
jgi:UDP-N-acetylmuramate: L-alanyl-gamma-D-glutamyl-meso-diaminopimelate ligase